MKEEVNDVEEEVDGKKSGNVVKEAGIGLDNNSKGDHSKPLRERLLCSQSGLLPQLG